MADEVDSFGCAVPLPGEGPGMDMHTMSEELDGVASMEEEVGAVLGISEDEEGGYREREAQGDGGGFLERIGRFFSSMRQHPASTSDPSTSATSSSHSSSSSPASTSPPAVVNAQQLTLMQALRPSAWRQSHYCVMAGVVSLVISYAILMIILFLASSASSSSSSSSSSFVPSPYASTLVRSTHGAVAADSELCSKAGVLIMQEKEEGGNAIDAAIATALCLGVVHPWSSGIGGGAVILVHTADGEEVVIDSREKATARAHRDMFEGRAPDAQYAPDGVAVPGELRGLERAFVRFGSGRVPWENLFTAAIEYAEELVLTAQHAHVVKVSEDDIRASPSMSAYYVKEDGSLLGEGEVLRRPLLANTLRTIAREGVDVFYEGEIGAALVADIAKYNSVYGLTAEDLRAYSIEERDVVEAHVNGARVIGAPPPFGSSLVLMGLNMMEIWEDSEASMGPSQRSVSQRLQNKSRPRLESSTRVEGGADGGGGVLTANTTRTTHLIVETMKYMFSDRNTLGDPAFVEGIEAYVEQIVSREHAASLAARIDEATTYSPPHYEDLIELRAIRTDHGTTHLCTADAAGNAVALTSTINLYFGSKAISQSTGIVLNNEMDDFSLPDAPNAYGIAPSEANFIAAGKRPLSSMSPIIALREVAMHGEAPTRTNGRGTLAAGKEAAGAAGAATEEVPILVAGASGGPRIITSTFQAVYNALRFLHDPAHAISPARLHHQLIPNVLEAEEGFPSNILDELEMKGHVINRNKGALAVEQMIARNITAPERFFLSASDHRKKGVAAGY